MGISEESKKNVELIDYLIKGAQLNDSLLQSYRQMHLTIQSIFIAIGVGLFIAILTFTKLAQVVLATLILTVLAGVSLYILYTMRRIIIARGDDVNFWHRKLILVEQDLPPNQRYFTEFKIYQRLHRTDANYLKNLFLTNNKISAEEIYVLVERGLGHTRKVLDRWLFIGINIIWFLLLAIGVGYTVYRYLGLP